MRGKKPRFCQVLPIDLKKLLKYLCLRLAIFYALFSLLKALNFLKEG